MSCDFLVLHFNSAAGTHCCSHTHARMYYSQYCTLRLRRPRVLPALLLRRLSSLI